MCRVPGFLSLCRPHCRHLALSLHLAPAHPPAEMHYVVRDSGASAVLCHTDMEAVAAPIAKAN